MYNHISKATIKDLFSFVEWVRTKAAHFLCNSWAFYPASSCKVWYIYFFLKHFFSQKLLQLSWFSIYNVNSVVGHFFFINCSLNVYITIIKEEIKEQHFVYPECGLWAKLSFEFCTEFHNVINDYTFQSKNVWIMFIVRA